MRLFDVSILTPTGGSYRTTVPVSVVRDLWKIEKKEFAVCFLEEKGRVFLIPFEELLEGDFPKEIKKQAIEKWSKKVLGSTVHPFFLENHSFSFFFQKHKTLCRKLTKNRFMGFMGFVFFIMR